MIHLIGNCAGVGSSLLSQILNRHSTIFSGQETHLFSKKALYTNWDENKSKILRKGYTGLRSPGWHLFNGVKLKDLDTSINPENFGNFFEYAHSLSNQIWIEKTPANIYCFNYFLSNFPDSKVIFMIRNPLENIASLMDRGLSSFQAVSRYLVSNAAGMTYECDRILIFRYEELIENPQYIIKKLCDYLNIDFENEMLNSTSENIKMSGWRAAENEAIQNFPSNRFDSLAIPLQDEAAYWINHLRINEKCDLFSGTTPKSVKKIASKMNYSLDISSGVLTRSTARLHLYLDHLIRSVRTYPTGFFNYPLKLI